MYVHTHMYLYFDHKTTCSIGLCPFTTIRVLILCVCELIPSNVRAYVFLYKSICIGVNHWVLWDVHTYVMWTIVRNTVIRFPW